MLNFFVCALLLFGLVSGTTRQFYKRSDLDYINIMKHGVLITTGKLSSCEVVPLDGKAAVVAASCLGYQSGTTTLDPSYTYEVLYDDGNDGQEGKYAVESITVHPRFNPSNYVNDIAVLQFNPSSAATWQGRLAPYAVYSWDTVVYRRTQPTNLAMLNGTADNYSSGINSTKCRQLSEMFEANSKDLVCNFSLTWPPSKKYNDCQVPMGVAYGIANKKAFIIGPYSHTAITNNSICDSVDERSYYISLGNYIEFIQNTIGRKLLVGDDGMGSPVLNADYSMVDSSFGDDNGIRSTKIGGDFYKNQKASDDDVLSSKAPDSSDMSSDDSLIASDDLDTNSDSDNAQDSSLDNNINGLSSREKVIIGVCVSVGGVLVIALLVYIWWKKWHNRKRVDPIYQDMLQTEIGGATLPAYSASNQVESDRDIRAFLANISAPSQGAADHQEVSQTNHLPEYNVSANNAAQALSTTVEKKY